MILCLEVWELHTLYIYIDIISIIIWNDFQTDLFDL